MLIFQNSSIHFEKNSFYTISNNKECEKNLSNFQEKLSFLQISNGIFYENTWNLDRWFQNEWFWTILIGVTLYKITVLIKFDHAEKVRKNKETQSLWKAQKTKKTWETEEKAKWDDLWWIERLWAIMRTESYRKPRVWTVKKLMRGFEKSARISISALWSISCTKVQQKWMRFIGWKESEFHLHLIQIIAHLHPNAACVWVE